MGENNLLEYDRLVNARGFMIGGRTGLITGLAADSIVASVRNSAVESLMVTRIAMGFSTTSTSNVLSGVAFAAYKLEGFTASPTSGRSTDPVPMRKRTAEHSVMAALEVEIADTAALVAGTPAAPTVDDPWCFFVCGTSVVSGVVSYQGQSAWEAKNIPLSIGQDEGLIVLCQRALPTNLAGRFYLTIECHRGPKA